MVVEACVQVALFNKTHKLNKKKKNVLWVRVGVMSALSTEEEAPCFPLSFQCDHFPKNIFLFFFWAKEHFFFKKSKVIRRTCKIE